MPVDPFAAADPSPALPAASTPPRPRRRLARAAQALLGLALGLGLVELGFRHRDGGAFPLVNVYAPDAQRGVRLAPGSVTDVGRPGERVTRVRVNDDGYRGPSWPAPSPGEVVVIGDSLSFGLGVAEEEALAARLHAALPGATAVLDASVPTYGPPEYLVTMDQVLARRKPGTVVLTINLINDLAELDRPNPARHTAVDGWAARVDPGAPTPMASPLRALAIRRSHAAFALWRWQRTREAAAAAIEPDPGLDELLLLARRVARATRALDTHQREEEERAAALAEANAELGAARAAVVALARRHKVVVAYARTLAQEWQAYLSRDGDPESDVFEVYYGGCAFLGPGRSNISRTRFTGTKIRADVEGLLKDLAGVLPRAQGQEIRDAFVRRASAEARVLAMPTAKLPPPAGKEPLPITPFLARAQALASARGARLVVLVAPLDAQVSLEARRRREVSDAAATSLDVLAAEIALAAREHGAIGVDATPTLQRLGAEAFLRDGHLSAAGHDAVARAVAEALTAEGPGAG
jgi:hypothetical protein